MRKVAVTGSLAAGKSVVCQILKDSCHAFVLDADELSHQVLDESPEIQQKLLKVYGPSIITNGKIDRKELASRVFGDAERLRQLETWLHPLIREKIEQMERRLSSSKDYLLFVVEIPLLFEAGWEKEFEVILSVEAPKDVRLVRTKSRGWTLEDFEKRERRQLPPADKSRRSHFVIRNRGTLEDLRHQVIELSHQF